MSTPDPCRRIFWDLETTGFLPMARIVSIGWSCNGHAREILVLPDGDIDSQASNVHGWTTEKLRSAGAVDIAAALADFCEALKGETRVVLCAHNGKSFDTHVLRAELERAHRWLPENVLGFVDTMQWCRKAGMTKCSLDALALTHLGQDGRDLHSAAADAHLLERVVRAIEAIGPSVPPLLNHLESADAFDLRTSKAAVRGVVDWMVGNVARADF